MISERIFREYDIRGIAGKDLDSAVAFLIGKAFASYVKRINPDASRVSIGRDVRLSSAELADGLKKGICSCGMNVYDIGVCPTPVQYFSLYHLDLDGGIMVTGSHNPPEYNGFKISVGKGTIHGKDIQKIREIIERKDWVDNGVAGTAEDYNIIGPYTEYMLGQFSYLNAPEFKKIKVVVDAGNGTAGIIAPNLLKAIGCDVVPLYCEPDGTFPNHHPDPTVVENIQDLILQTRQTGADLGVGYDGDSDRIGVVSREGKIIWGDQIMIVLSRELLKESPGEKIIGDVKCSQIMFDDIEKHQGVPIMWKTGHSLVKQKMREEGALIAGEFSGHIFIAHRYFGYDDALYTTLRLVEIIKKTGSDIKELLSDIPEMFFTPEMRVDCPDEIKQDVVRTIVAAFVEYRDKGTSPFKILSLNMIDGVRVVFENGWGLVRTSNTQPIVVLRVEAGDEASLRHYKEFLMSEFHKAREGK